ncbi:MAG: LysM peptidoglycan-binding domain-containing protein [Bacteroidota bacterium]
MEQSPFKNIIHTISFLLLLQVLPSSIWGSGDSTRYLIIGDTLNLTISSFNEKIITHSFEKGQTLFSLSKFYGLNVEELKYYNPGLLDGVAIGDLVQIPIPNRAIIRYPDARFDYQHHIPLYYTIQKGDTFYGLSKRIFKMPIEEVQRRLYPSAEALKVGQKLFVGWISINGVLESERVVRGHPLLRKNQELRDAYLSTSSKGRPMITQGAAAWIKDKSDSNNFLALFNDAPSGSYIEILYPMRNRRVYAKVVGKIPVTLYESNIKIVVSPLTAKLLGARDDEFFVKIYH